ncbi:hypothetical protein [Leptospira santarosai]|uniref:Uncharacterized protein n=1 Tax=Leptospira santarosai str. CBC1416 TaxID=1193059 RepID=M6VVM5_9LEPT|nr:hypothetical protein [Leptospira santarosai]EMO59206.1 hypothetical protein LEP1GSC161_0799 [Leptospira santarosai str. CBC1416]ASV11834.1 hypothetical protein B2G51_08960 [Leptospira santarosai]AVV50161.1 Uncharacterized protein XB17_01570 [Leptospira santarosai]AVV80687.1 Uncharacterized protein XB15_02943 [Leptospira santarosai]MDO6383498.1 hypothetical protein [Leptospira santarosai]
MGKVTVKRKRNKILCSYDRFHYTSLIGIFISLLIIAAIFFDMVEFETEGSNDTYERIFGLLFSGVIFFVTAHRSFNSINIEIDAWYVIVYSFPIPTQWRKKIRKQDIKKIVIGSEDHTSEGSFKESYSIYCILNDRNEILILNRIWDIADAGEIKSILSDSLETPKVL